MTPVIFFATGDFGLGMFLFLTAGKNKWQRGIGAWFIAMMIVHISYWVSEPKINETAYTYWAMITFLGWGQLFHVGYWYYKTSGNDSLSNLFDNFGFNNGEKS